MLRVNFRVFLYNYNLGILVIIYLFNVIDSLRIYLLSYIYYKPIFYNLKGGDIASRKVNASKFYDFGRF